VTAAVCPVCDRPQDAGLLCSACCDVLERELRDVPDVVHNLDVTRAKMARIGAGAKGGLPSERTPIGWGAVDPRWVLENVLTTWARDIMGYADAEWNTAFVPNRSPSITAAYILLSNVPLIRKHPAVVELVDEITDAIRQARRVVDRPADKVYLGQCLMVTPDEDGRDVTCLEEVWARAGASETTCKVCGVTHEVGERRAWLLQKCEDYLFTVKDASQMMGDVGHITVTQASIRGYIHRGKIGYRSGNLIRLGDLMAVVLDEGERKSA
jgi:hypothetical protein